VFTRNTHPSYRRALSGDIAGHFGPDAAAQAGEFFTLHPAYQATPLAGLPALAAELGVGALHLKDESKRLDLCSFKALGGMYAVVRLVQAEACVRLGRPVGTDELSSPAVRAVAAGMVFACATDGNHGRSVAAGAHLVRASCHVFVHVGVDPARRAAIAQLGAALTVVPGTYDDAVDAAARACAEHGWHCVSDTAWPGYEQIPLMVMQGYTLLLREALEQLGQPPTHVFVQAGVGGLAAALGACLALRFGPGRPTLVVVEPARAACLLSSMFAGAATRIAHIAPTSMAMLECHTPSTVAWDILTHVGDAFMTVDEAEARATVVRLAHPLGADPVLRSTESGGAGLAGLVRAAADPTLRGALDLDERSRVLVINTEGPAHSNHSP
jgi:diaminopropionate ammonia-lyase